jgi:lipopolysaccharide heptosyltransferase II
MKRLVIAPNWLGDGVMAIPFLRALKRDDPSGRLAVLGRKSTAPIFPLSGAVDEVWESRGRDLPGFWRDAARGRRARFDEIWVLPHSFRSALLARAMRGRRRIGYAADRRNALLTSAVPRPPAIEHQLRDEDPLLASAGIAPDDGPPRLSIPGDLAAAVERELCAHELSASRPVFLAPGAAFGPTKLWPAERFALLADALLDRGEKAALLVGPGEVELGMLIARRARHRVPILGGELDTAKLAALLARGKLLIGNDSGPAHLAAAVGTPTVVFFGPTDPGRTAPRGAPSIVLDRYVFCSPCFLKTCPYQHECLEEISVSMALEAALRMLGTDPPPSV